MGYRGICHASLLLSVYTRALGESQVAGSTVSREKAFVQLLHPMPKSSENLRKFSEELGNLQEFPKTLSTIQNCY